MDTEAAGFAGKQKRKSTDGWADPVFVADHRDALKRRGVPGTKPGIGRHRVALHLASLGSEEVEQPHLATLGDLPPQHRLNRLLPIVVLDLADRKDTPCDGANCRRLRA